MKASHDFQSLVLKYFLRSKSSYSTLGGQFQFVLINITLIYKEMGKYSKALETQQTKLSPNHPVFATPYNNIGLVNHDMSDTSYFERARDILPHKYTYSFN